jgi:hypothetical protein
VGRYFVPGQLNGYFNDYSFKTEWNGESDEDGIPLNQSINGKPFYFPLTVLQKALGHWERWLSSDRTDEQHRAEFLRLARWMIHRQDERGGWPTWPDCGVRTATPYSAMTQGQAVSVLVRAFSITGDRLFIDGARSALGLMTMPIERGGTAHEGMHGVVLEEVPLVPPRTVLNGWINGIYGLYDFLLIEQSESVAATLESTVEALVRYLPRFEARYWSYYDTHRNLASPYYHDRHIAQLKACERTFPKYGPEWRRMRETLERQAASRVHRTVAVALKAIQQLRNPPESVMK